MTYVSYASNFEDVLLLRMFAERQSGIYVDIGADHPTYWSTTKVFYDRGWHGINVEPGPHFEDLAAQRPRDINIRGVVLDRAGEVDFFLHEGLLGTSTVQAHIDPGLSAYDLRRRKIRVKAVTLRQLAEEYPEILTASFVKIDAEGAEDSIVAEADWTVLRPEVLLIEATKPYSNERCDARRMSKLKANGFREAYFDGVNAWLVREESAELLRHFRLPVNQLDGFMLFDPEKEHLALQVAALKRQVALLERGVTGLMWRSVRGVVRLLNRNKERI
jgi:FkbM family methyltransferase